MRVRAPLPRCPHTRGAGGVQRRGSKTPHKLFRALLHRDDEFDVKLQIAANRALSKTPEARVVSFDSEPPTEVPAPAILVSERPLDDAQRAARTRDPTATPTHGSLDEAPHAPVWLYLLAHRKPRARSEDQDGDV